MKKNILGIICVILVIAFSSFCINANASNNNVNAKNGWVYTNHVDEMDGSIIKGAYIVSSNVAYFDSPYDGGSTLGIGIVGTEYDGLVSIWISDGQFISDEYNGTNYVRVRFDNDAPINFSTREPYDYSNDMLIIKDSEKFIKLAKKAKTIKIEASFFTEGSRVFTFNINKPLEL